MSGARPLGLVWLGVAPYRATAELQERLRERVLDGSGDEVVLLCEHPPVITLGRSARADNVLVDDAALARAGVERVATARGGDVTYHGPGQLVAYPIVHVPDGAPAYVCALANAVIDVVAPLGVEGARYRCDAPGVWVGDAKLCAFGVHLRRGVAIHGLALNLHTRLEAFSWIVPCGLRGAAVTSVAALLGAARTPTPAELALPLGRAIAARLGRAAEERDAAQHATQALLS